MKVTVMSRWDAVFYCRHATGADSSIFENGLYDPNLWCYRKTLEALSRS